MKSQISNRTHNLILLLKVAIIALSFLDLYAQQPTLTWVGTLGGSKSEARGISANGTVIVGVSRNANESDRAFRWSAATGIQDLGTLGGDWIEATDVSADGSVIVGWSYDSSGIYRAFKWTSTTGMQDLGVGDYSKATAVSEDGLAITVNVNSMAYRWTASGGLQNLGNLGGTSTEGSDISADGSVIGGFSNDSTGDPYAFRWSSTGGMIQIGTFYSFALGLSGNGSTVTGFETGSAGLYRAFRWTQTGGFEFNIAGNFSQGNAVSGDGTIIVGNKSGGAFRFSTAGGLEDLNQVYASLLTQGSNLYDATDISPDGQFITGTGTNGETGRDEGYLLALSGATSIYESQYISGHFMLNQNYPNPFNPSTIITFSVTKKGLVSLKVFNSLGEEVAELVNETKPAGNYEVNFNVSGLASGVYYYQVTAGDFHDVKKMILLK